MKTLSENALLVKDDRICEFHFGDDRIQVFISEGKLAINSWGKLSIEPRASNKILVSTEQR